MFDQITSSIFNSSQMLILSEPVMGPYDSLVPPLFRILLNGRGPETLANMHDILLPKLLSRDLLANNTDPFRGDVAAKANA
jgi:hypothetical protein